MRKEENGSYMLWYYYCLDWRLMPEKVCLPHWLMELTFSTRLFDPVPGFTVIGSPSWTVSVFHIFVNYLDLRMKCCVSWMYFICTCLRKKQKRHWTNQCNIEGFPCILCCGKTISITYSECVIRLSDPAYSEHVSYHVVTSSLSKCTIIFPHYINGTNFGKRFLNVYFDFLWNTCLKISYSEKKWARCYKCTYVCL